MVVRKKSPRRKNAPSTTYSSTLYQGAGGFFFAYRFGGCFIKANGLNMKTILLATNDDDVDDDVDVVDSDDKRKRRRRRRETTTTTNDDDDDAAADDDDDK